MPDDDFEGDVRAAIEGTSPERVIEAPIPETREPVVDKTGRVHGEGGKFATKAAPVDEQQQQVQSPITQAVEPETAILPPHSLKAAVKAQFAALPKDVQDEFLRIEGEALKAKTEWQSKGEQYNRFEKLFEPIADRLTLSGVNREQYVQALIRADQMLRDNPSQALPQIAQMYGINLPGYQAPQQPYVDPVVQQLQSQVQQLTSTLQSQQTAGEQAKMQEAQGEIAAFRSSPDHLYFDNVAPLMASFLKDGRAQTLTDAYDMAIHADPTIRTLVAAAGQPKAQPGKPKSLSVSGAPGQTQASPRTTNSAEDDVRAAIEELTGRV